MECAIEGETVGPALAAGVFVERASWSLEKFKEVVHCVSGLHDCTLAIAAAEHIHIGIGRLEPNAMPKPNPATRRCFEVNIALIDGQNENNCSSTSYSARTDGSYVACHSLIYENQILLSLSVSQRVQVTSLKFQPESSQQKSRRAHALVGSFIHRLDTEQTDCRPTLAPPT